ncbi:ATP-binding protein [Chitinophaga caseinilytica]|uniref:ATP-binding protein n=1 Tax=Chitinophaga caseinilytica TaxID=2267521 RepID=A0ABZ2Z695_9BACT
MKNVTSIPNAPRTFEALRSLGYDLNSSVADVIDNSISEKTGGKNIQVFFDVNENARLTCIIQDDGCGMNEAELEEAMRLGAEAEYNEQDLGKFGMGMKTASLSHCNVLTVISKKRRSQITAFRWDIRHIKNSGWQLLQLNQSEINKLLQSRGLTIGSCGTIVLWEDLQWIDQEIESYSSEKLARNYVFKLKEQLKLHLRMVYHRFLEGKAKYGKVHIELNGENLVPWDPYCRSEKNTLELSLTPDHSKVKFTGFRTPVKISAYILPTKEGFSTEDAWKEGKGLLPWNDGQGYYIYRADRLIRFGGWHGTKAKDEHDKLARISIDIDPELDSLFRITVNKSRVQLPEQLFHHLKEIVNPYVVKKAKAKYKKSEDGVVVKNNFRNREDTIARVSMEVLTSVAMRASIPDSKNGNVATVTKQAGKGNTYLQASTNMHDFLSHGSIKDFEIESAHFEKHQLWKIVSKHGNSFKVSINASHPFYSIVYNNGGGKKLLRYLMHCFARLHLRNFIIRIRKMNIFLKNLNVLVHYC